MPPRRGYLPHQDLALEGATIREAAEASGASGVVMHSVPLETFAFLRHTSDPLLALTEVIAAGTTPTPTLARDFALIRVNLGHGYLRLLLPG